MVKRNIILKMVVVLASLNLLVIIVVGQPKPEEIPLYESKFSADILDDLKSNIVRASRAAELFSYIAEYDLAISTFPSMGGPLRDLFDTLSGEDRQYFEAFRPTLAKPIILERAISSSVVIFNEAHHKPIHRAYLRTLLQDLYLAGFRYLGLEALNVNVLMMIPVI